MGSLDPAALGAVVRVGEGPGLIAGRAAGARGNPGDVAAFTTSPTVLDTQIRGA